MRNNPSFRIESEIDRVLVLHLFQTICKVTFLCDTVHGWEVIYFLEGFELTQLIRGNCNVVPDNIDIRMTVGFIFLRLLSL